MRNTWLLTLLAFFSIQSILSQSISGTITDPGGNPVPYANIYFRQLETGTAADDKGYYYFNIDPGAYDVVFSALGFETISVPIIVEDESIVFDIAMDNSSIDLDQIVVKGSRKNPALEIIRKTIEQKKKFMHPLQSLKSDVYLRAVEKIKGEKPVKKQAKDVDDNPMDIAEESPEDPVKKLAGTLNLVEVKSTLNYQTPDKFKEYRQAYKKSGNVRGLYVPLLEEANFNFYKSLIDFKNLAEVPIISPISRTGIVSYKYKLVSTKKLGDQSIHEIKYTPRKSGNSVGSGIIWIVDELWKVHAVEMKLKKNSLKFYDEFIVSLSYEYLQDTISYPTKQVFQYKTKSGRFKSYEGETVIKYKDLIPNYSFPDKFFGYEVAVTDKEAYKRDSTYWNQNRSEPLGVDLMKVVRYRDSVEAYYNSDVYKDSVEQAYNKIEVLDILWTGVGFRNHRKKRTFYVSSIPSLIGFDAVSGFRFGPYISYSKRFDNGQYLFTSANINIGQLNQDLQGSNYTRWFYNPFKLGWLSLDLGRQFQLINSFDAYINQLRSSNHILNDYISFTHRRELFNGFYLWTRLNFSARKSIENYDRTNVFDWVIGEDDEPIPFQDYNTFITDWSISYTPRQRFMTEPNRKVVLGSNYPTFRFRHKKGWNGLFKSDVNFDFLEFSVDQDIVMGIFGNSKYSFRTGKFLNTKELKFVDYKFFRQSDPFLYSDPLNSFQLLDTTLTSTGLFFEFHHIHHFNGALINNIPLVKKLRFQVVGGAGFLYVNESNFRYQEIFLGLERIFKLGPRRKLRVGLYGVVGKAKGQRTTTGPKISFDIIDTWKRDWSF